MKTDLITLSADDEARAEKVHTNSVIIDGTIPVDVYLTDDNYRDNLARGGITAANFTVTSIDEFLPTVERLQQFWSWVENDEGKTIIQSVEDIRRAKDQGQVGVILGFQNASPIGFNLDFARAFHQMGVRAVQLTYNSQNYVGSGCWETNDTGLSHFGHDLISELNRLGIVIDLSHCGDKTAMDAIEASTDPVIFSHVTATAISHARGRGKPDDQIAAVADNGGVIGITMYPAFVKHDPETHEALPTDINDVLDHIDHVVEVGGIDHIGFGTDLSDKHFAEGISTGGGFGDRHARIRDNHPEIFSATSPEEFEPPSGLDRHTKMINLTRGLIDRGYSDDEISKILGGNFMRVFEYVWE